jgi:hypothetical protein
MPPSQRSARKQSGTLSKLGLAKQLTLGTKDIGLHQQGINFHKNEKAKAKDEVEYFTKELKTLKNAVKQTRVQNGKILHQINAE